MNETTVFDVQAEQWNLLHRGWELRKQESLRTRDKAAALRILTAKNEAYRQPAINLQLAQVYLQHGDPETGKWTWQTEMDEIVKIKKGSTWTRWGYAIKETALDSIRDQPLLHTKAEHFLRVLESGTVSTNVHLRKLHNFALGMNWLAWPILPRKPWPAVRFKDKRAITLAEHAKIVERERNPENRAFYQLLWCLGGSRSDSRVGSLTADWERFSEWKRIQREDERRRVSLKVMLRGTCHRASA